MHTMHCALRSVPASQGNREPLASNRFAGELTLLFLSALYRLQPFSVHPQPGAASSVSIRAMHAMGQQLDIQTLQMYCSGHIKNLSCRRCSHSPAACCLPESSPAPVACAAVLLAPGVFVLSALPSHLQVALSSVQHDKGVNKF